MSNKSKMEYLRAIYQRYHRAYKALRIQILNEFCQVCGYNRKYAIRLLNNPLPGKTTKQPKTRKPTYSAQVISILTFIWEAAGYPWSQRLKALLPLWMPWIKKRFHITAPLERQLLSITPATIDRRLKSRKLKLKKNIYGRTKPGTLLKHHIPIKTDSWDINTPGYTEVDMVSHSGNSADGHFIYSLNMTDIHTTWVESRAVMGRAQEGVIKAIEEMRISLPFTLKAIDSDNGSEFINDQLYRYCKSQQIQFTRGRPYKKNDNAHVEQKNWTHVRRLLGYVRYDSEPALNVINDLYQNEFRLFCNLFQPSVKLLRKERIGSKLKRIYDQPKTPFDRLSISKEVDPLKMAELNRLRESLDPFKLSAIIDHKLTRIYQTANHRIRSDESPTPKTTSTTTKSEPLSRIEKETIKTLSEVFGIPVYVKIPTKHENP